MPSAVVVIWALKVKADTAIYKADLVWTPILFSIQMLFFDPREEDIHILIKTWQNMKFYIQLYEGESISKQPNLFPVESHLFFFDVIAL